MQIRDNVKVISNASYKHYRKVGKVVGFCKNPDMCYVQFLGEKNKILFMKSSLEKVLTQ